MKSRWPTARKLSALFACLNIGMAGNFAVAGDKTWDGFANNNWDTTSLNFGGTAWNNAAGDGAIFNAFGAGAINVPGTINLDSLNITSNGYSYNGTGPLHFAPGSSTLSTGVINVATGTAQINVPLSSAGTAVQKIGGGVLELSSPLNLAGSTSLVSNGVLSANLIIGTTAYNPSVAAGTVRVTNASVLPSNITVAIGSSSTLGSSAPYLDIGSNNVTIGALTFVNQNTSGVWNNVVNANNGVIGTGTLRVLGDIHVIGVGGFNPGNSIAANVDLGGGTQIVRTGVRSQFGLHTALMFTGSLSNGSLTKTLGYTNAGIYGSMDGISLFGNNTYTGATVLNSGTNVATGTNASTSIKITGIGGPGGSLFALQGANGSFLSATTIEATSGGTFILDNNAALGATGNNQPNIPAAQNNNRIRDDAAMILRDGNFTYRGFSAAAATETFGSLSSTGGHNVVAMTPNGGGSTTLTVAGDLTLSPRSTMQFTATGTGNTLGGNARIFFGGNVPAASNGIIPNIIGPSDFVTYNGTTGITPLAAGDYAGSLTAGANVNLTAASGTSGSVAVNALKATGSFTTTLNAGHTLSVNTGMMLSTATHTIAGTGTLDFGSNPGVFFGSHTISAPITGSQGLVQASGTLNLSGNLAGLTGTISNIGTGTTIINTNTFSGAFEVRRGVLQISTNTLSAGGAITLGVSANDADLLPSLPELNFSTAGVNAVIARNIVIDNKGFTAAGLTLDRFSYVTKFTPLSNNTGSQTFNGNLTLNSSVNLQGGAGTGTGATNFNGDISGPATFVLANGRANFNGSYSNDGGVYMGNTGFTAILNFNGTGSGNGPIVINGGSNSNSGISYTTASNLYAGPITVQNAGGSTAPSIRILGTSSINNTVNLNGDVVVDVGSGLTGTWAGQLTGTSTLTKNNTGTLVLANNTNTHTGPVTVNAGTLAVNGNLAPSTNAVTINNGATLAGSGIIARTVTVNSGGILSPGNSPSQLTIDSNLTLASGSNYRVELNGTVLGTGYDNTTVTGANRTVNITGSNLVATTTMSPPGGQYFIMVLTDNSSTLTGTFAGVAQDGFINIQGNGAEYYSAQVSYTGDFVANTLTGGNDIVVYGFAAVPEPATIALVALLGVGGAGGWYYRRRKQQQQLNDRFARR
jgi:fibronectin-binding autotransporter adhesin